MIKSKATLLLFTISMLLGAFSANAICSGCVFVGPADPDFDDPAATYSAVVKQLIWYTNENGQQTTRWNYTTLTGRTLAYCQQQVSAVMASPNVSIVQFCQKD